MMNMPVMIKAFSFLCLLSLFLLPTLQSTSAADRNTYIVHVRLPNFIQDPTSWYKSFLSSVTSDLHFVHSYTNVVTGFAAQLTETELDVLSVLPEFVRAYPDSMYQLHTTHTPGFLGLHLSQGVWNESRYGMGIIVGVLDTGILPDHPSFNGEGMPPPPAKWKGRCDFQPSSCNNKLIGARAFLGATMGAPPIDNEGHGTHTTSTAAGARVPGAQVVGNAYGTATGIAPLAHVAIYKVCDETGCAGSDILAGIEAAVSDGVDVLSLSLGGTSMPFYADPIAVGAFAAIKQGIFVSCAAGNSGPRASTLSNEAPWILTVAASTIDRRIKVTVQLGNGQTFDGESLYQPKAFAPVVYPLVYAGASGNATAEFCANGSLDGFKVKGKIVLCKRGGGVARIDKGAAVKNAGGVGMILMNEKPDGYSTLADAHVLPASHVTFADGDEIMAYIKSTTNPTAEFQFNGTILGTSPAPAITSFSSRGPSLASPGILKPDITGPGVSILAAWPFQVGPPSNSSTAMTFNIISGTSMSTPHLSGIAALIKSVHPEWSPAAIKSAIMTTATEVDLNGGPILNEQHLPADLYALGAGHVNPASAIHPGLVFDLAANDYIGYLCGLGYSSVEVSIIARRPVVCELVSKVPEKDLNYPSISVTLGGTVMQVTAKRTVKNVGTAPSSYVAKVGAPRGVTMEVVPTQLNFTSLKEEMRFQVAFKISGGGGGAGSLAQGYLKWVSDNYTVTSRILITYKN